MSDASAAQEVYGMIRTMRTPLTLVLAILIAGVSLSSLAQAPSPKIGIVIMHGKGGSPSRHVTELASALEQKGYLVANLEMPWSGRRDYDVNVGAAVTQVESALGTLRSNGAQKLFVAGHSQGGLFALYLGGKQPVDGIIAIAPGGDVSNAIFRSRLGASVDLARKLIADGKGEEMTRFSDFEGAKGTYPVLTTPSAYLSWFDPDGAMNQTTALKQVNPQVPVLFIAPTGDYPGLRKIKDQSFSLLPGNPLNKLYEPDSSHLNAPSASRDEIVRWTTEVAGRAEPAPQGMPARERR
jgi:alpha-beta hydrolase superfamily lysophospholipase